MARERVCVALAILSRSFSLTLFLHLSSREGASAFDLGKEKSCKMSGVKFHSGIAEARFFC